VAFELLRRLLHAAADYNADLMATLCPMCQLNVDGYQGEVNRYFHTNYRMPVIFFTQLIGLAFGLEPKALGFGRELVDAGPALARIGVEPPPAAPSPAGPRPRRGQPEGLPMPSMPPE
jgi:heterodisulfide reductase subunit B